MPRKRRTWQPGQSVFVRAYVERQGQPGHWQYLGKLQTIKKITESHAVLGNEQRFRLRDGEFIGSSIYPYGACAVPAEGRYLAQYDRYCSELATAGQGRLGDGA